MIPISVLHMSVNHSTPAGPINDKIIVVTPSQMGRCPKLSHVHRARCRLTDIRLDKKLSEVFSPPLGLLLQTPSSPELVLPQILRIFVPL